METSRQSVDQGGEVQIQEEAQADARTERSALLPRIPKLTIEIKGEGDFTLFLGTREIAAKMVGVPLPVDPGKIEVRFMSGGQQDKITITLAEGDRETISFKATESETTSPSDDGGSLRVSDSGSSTGNTQKIVGWTSIGLGGAALIGGGITTGILASKRSALGCDGSQCPPTTDQGELASYNSLRPVATVLFAAGGALALTGFVLLMTAPKDSDSAYVSPYLGLSSAGFTGRF